MRLGAFLAVTLLVLVTLVSAFPQVVAGVPERVQDRASREESRSNIEDHMYFTRELAAQAVELKTLKEQHQAMLNIPVEVARIQEQMVTFSRMILAILGGVFTLLVKEIAGWLKVARPRRADSNGGVT